MQLNDIKSLIEAALPNAQVTVQGDDGVHFEAVVVSEDFVGKSLVQQHRLVNAALREHLESGAIHALALKTYTPETWQNHRPA